MYRSQLQHVIYEIGRRFNLSDFYIVGSAAILAVLPNPPNCSVIGGFVYRGNAIPSAKGRYFFSDNCAGRVRSVRAGGSSSVRDEPFRVDGSSSFGEDARGELYVMSVTGGNVYKIAN